MIKKVLINALLTITLLFSANALYSGSIEPIADTTVSGTDADGTLVLNAYAKNISGTNKTIELRLYKIDVNPSHQVTFCYGANCYTLENNTNWNNVDIVDVAPDASTLLLLDIYTNYTVGTSKVKVEFRIKGDTTDKIEFIATFVVGTSGVPEYTISNIKVYPNPAGSSFTLSTGETMIPVGSVLDIYNNAGQPVKSLLMNNTNQTINSDELPAGSYMMNINSNGKTISPAKKLIISR